MLKFRKKLALVWRRSTIFGRKFQAVHLSVIKQVLVDLVHCAIQLDSLAAYIRHKPHLSLRCLVSKLDSNVSHETVRNALRDMTYSKPYPTLSPMLSEVHKINRVKWAKKYRYPVKEWSKTIFIDEMSIWLAKGRLRMWTKRGKKCICPTTKHSAKINVWAAFSSIGVFPLCVFRENMNSQLFISIIEGHLLKQAEVFHGTDWRVVMDNDPKHTSLLSRQWIEENIPNKMPLPSQSPDMNPIENPFGWLKQKLVKKGPKTIKQLKDMLEEIWSNVDPEFLSSYLEVGHRGWRVEYKLLNLKLFLTYLVVHHNVPYKKIVNK